MKELILTNSYIFRTVYATVSYLKKSIYIHISNCCALTVLSCIPTLEVCFVFILSSLSVLLLLQRFFNVWNRVCVECCIRKTRKIAFLIYSSGAFHEVGLQSFFFFFTAALCLYCIFLPAWRILTILQRDFSFKEYVENKSLVPGPDASLKILQTRSWDPSCFILNKPNKCITYFQLAIRVGTLSLV